MSVITAEKPRALTRVFEYRFSPKRFEPDRQGFRFDEIPTWSQRRAFECRRCDRRPEPARPPRRHSWGDQYAETVMPRLARLQRLARRILRSDDLADDAVQEALLSLWQEGKLPPNVDGWLVRTVVHRSLHMNRSRRRRRVHEERACLRRSELDVGGDASRSLEGREVVRAIDAALGALPEHLRVAFVLREAEQLDYEAIAHVLRVPVGTVRSRLHRAREALKAVLYASGRDIV